MDHHFVIGVSALYHDSAAALLCDGRVVAAAQEERFSRKKNDPSLPVQAIEYCLLEGNVPRDAELTVAYYEKPLSSFVRVLKTFASIGYKGMSTFPQAMEESLRRKLWVSYGIDRALKQLGRSPAKETLYAEHHMSHAAAAFYPSPFDSAAVLTFDGVGEWATSSIGVGSESRIDLLQEMRFPDSLGLLYSAFTSACGFGVNSGEYKLMGLAPFGQPRYVEKIFSELIDLREDGSFTLNLDYFDYLAGKRMTSKKFNQLFDGPPRVPEAAITRRECDLAHSIQVVLEEIVLRVAHHAQKLTGETQAVLGGGVALNCVANGRLLREGPFRKIWVQPAAGDAGSALGCALWAWHQVYGNERPDPQGQDSMEAALLGPTPSSAFTLSTARDSTSSSANTAETFRSLGRPCEQLTHPEKLAEQIAAILAEDAILGLCTGRMEFGPRALGNRSILADPRSPAMQRRLNLSIKNRESFRPFAPIVLEDRSAEFFMLDGPSPYMSFVAPVRGVHLPTDSGHPNSSAVDSADSDSGNPNPAEVMDLSAQLQNVDSPLPAVTHVDGTARIQTVDAQRNPGLHSILTAFERLTDCPVLVNTSFNVRGEPIVLTAEDAYRCFMTTQMDYLVIEDCLFDKRQQPDWTDQGTTVLAD
ncbi:MAG: carbamoyltransferase N-terminal domain-containing protein [Microthrixaceae bacterium]